MKFRKDTVTVSLDGEELRGLLSINMTMHQPIPRRRRLIQMPGEIVVRLRKNAACLRDVEAKMGSVEPSTVRIVVSASRGRATVMTVCVWVMAVIGGHVTLRPMGIASFA